MFGMTWDFMKCTFFMHDGAVRHIAKRLKDLFYTSFDDDYVLSATFVMLRLLGPKLYSYNYLLWGCLVIYFCRVRCCDHLFVVRPSALHLRMCFSVALASC